MPGLVGAFGASDHATVADMQRVLAHRAATICGPRPGGGNPRSPDGPRRGDDAATTLPTVHIAGHVSNRRALAQLLADHGQPADDGAVETVVARLFATMGPSCLRHVQGHFALVVRSATQIVLLRDRFGTVPLHYVVAPDRSCLLVASEAKALVGRLGVSPTIDLERLADVLVFGDILGDGTLLRHIKKVRPGTAVLASLADGRVEIHVESVPPVARPVHLPFDEETVLDAIGRTIAGGVTACADGLGQVGVALSGGLDSSVVTLLAAEHLGRDALTTFTLSSPSATEDLHAARELAGTLGVQHASIPVTFDAYLRAIPHCIFARESGTLAGMSLFLLSAEVGRHAATCLTGIGADDFFPEAYRGLNWTLYAARLRARLERLRARRVPVSPEAMDLAQAVFRATSYGDYFDSIDYRDSDLTWIDMCAATNGVDVHMPFYFDPLDALIGSIPRAMRDGPPGAPDKHLLRLLAVRRFGSAARTAVSRSRRTMPDVIVDFHREFAQRCRSTLGEHYGRRHPFGALVPEPQRLFLLDLFVQLFVWRTPPEDLDVGEFLDACAARPPRYPCVSAQL